MIDVYVIDRVEGLDYKFRIDCWMIVILKNRKVNLQKNEIRMKQICFDGTVKQKNLVNIVFPPRVTFS